MVLLLICGVPSQKVQCWGFLEIEFVKKITLSYVSPSFWDQNYVNIPKNEEVVSFQSLELEIWIFENSAQTRLFSFITKVSSTDKKWKCIELHSKIWQFFYKNVSVGCPRNSFCNKMKIEIFHPQEQNLGFLWKCISSTLYPQWWNATFIELCILPPMWPSDHQITKDLNSWLHSQTWRFFKKFFSGPGTFVQDIRFWY